MSEKEVELTIKNKELALQVEKLTCALKLMMSPIDFSMEDKIDIMEDFDISSNKEEAKLVYEKYLKNNTIQNKEMNTINNINQQQQQQQSSRGDGPGIA